MNAHCSLTRKRINFFGKAAKVNFSSRVWRKWSGNYSRVSSSAPRKFTKHTNTAFSEVLKPSKVALSKKICRQRLNLLATERSLEPMKKLIPLLFKTLHCFVAICSRSCFSIQQKSDCANIEEVGTSKNSTAKNSNYQIDSLEMKWKKKGNLTNYLISSWNKS